MNCVSELFKKVEELLASKALKSIINSDFITLKQILTAQSILIKAGIPYDLTFSPGTRRAAAAAKLTIFINPTTTLSFTFAFERGGSFFG